uniref:Transmembrane protein 242 n=1 Tax=Strigamia maritima TaxID=126957 RepID=T1IUG1_STRMM
MDKNENLNENDAPKRENLHNLKAIVFLSSVTGMSVLFGFGMALSMAKRKDPSSFTKGLIASKEAGLVDSGGALAMRALGWGTVYAIGGFSAFLLVSWKLLGLHNIKELPDKMKAIMPSVPQPESTGRSDFKSFRELMEYIIESDKGKKK